MKFDVYATYSHELTSDDGSTAQENSIRKRFRNLTLEEAKSQVNSFFDSIPTDSNNVYIEIHKSYEEQMDAALKSI